MDEAGASTQQPARRFPLKAIGAAVIAAGLFGLAGYLGLGAIIQAKLQLALDWIDGLGGWGPAIFILVYTVTTVLLVPGSVLTLGAGAVFGVVKGSLIVSAASVSGATAAFFIGRYLARDWVAKKIAGNETFQAIDEGVADDGWKIVGLTRLSPAFPFTLLNYAYGLTRVKAGHYILASWIGMMPGTVMYVYVGSLAKSAAQAEGRSPAQWTLYIVGLIATILATVLITRRAKRALEKKTNKESARHA